MNRSKPGDPGYDADLGPGRDVLRQTIGALVDGATPPGVPSAPEENLGLLRRRVRRWRVAKTAAAGLSTAVVVSALAFSAAQASTWTRTEPLPGRPTVQSTETGPAPSETPTRRPSPSPSVSVSPSPSPSPSASRSPRVRPSEAATVEPSPDPSAPTAAPDPVNVISAPFDDGYQPWGNGFPVWCGMQDEDLVSTSPSLSIRIIGELRYRQGDSAWIPVQIDGEMPGYAESGDPGSTETIGDGALLVWSQGGRVVDLGQAWRGANYEIPERLNEARQWAGEAYASSYTTCVEADKIEDGMAYDNVRAAGTYQIRAVQAHLIGDPGREGAVEDYLVVSDPVTVTIP